MATYPSLAERLGQNKDLSRQILFFVSGVTNKFGFLLSHKLPHPPSVTFTYPHLSPQVITKLLPSYFQYRPAPLCLSVGTVAAVKIPRFSPCMWLSLGNVTVGATRCEAAVQRLKRKKTATTQKHIRLINTDSRSLWCFVPRKKLNHNLLACGLHRLRYIDCLEPLFCSAVATLLASKSELLLREMTVPVTEEVFLKETYINSGYILYNALFLSNLDKDLA